MLNRSTLVASVQVNSSIKLRFISVNGPWSTAVEQVVACALVTQRARVRSPVWTGFLGEVFFGVFPHL